MKILLRQAPYLMHSPVSGANLHIQISKGMGTYVGLLWACHPD